MVQKDTRMGLTPWRPTPTVLPSLWQRYLEEHAHKIKVTTNYIAGMRYEGQETVKLLCEWGLPWIVVVAGALLFQEEKAFWTISATDTPQLLSHVRQARHYIDCIEDEDFSILFSSPYDDLGALLIAVAAYYASLQGLSQHKNKRPLNQHVLSRIESIGTTLIHILKQVNLWVFKRDVEDLMLQLRNPTQYIDTKEELQKILRRDEAKLRDVCRFATVFCQMLTHIPIDITYAVCGIEGFLRRQQAKQTQAQENQLTGFDMVIFDVLVLTFGDCYSIFGAISCVF